MMPRDTSFISNNATLLLRWKYHKIKGDFLSYPCEKWRERERGYLLAEAAG